MNPATPFGPKTPGFSGFSQPFGNTGTGFTSPFAQSNPSTFGQTGATTQNNPASPFGQPANANIFGQNTSTFGTPTSQPTFGSTPAQSAFGAPAQPTFGAQSTPALGATSTPAFGATSTAPAFGATSTAPAFGATSSTPAFGATSATPAFGATSTTPAFGATSTTPAFGATSTTPAFGATSTAPAFGATSTAPAFGATSTAPAFGATSTAPAFGATTTAPTFGAPTTTPSFGATGFGTPSTTSSAFGAAKPLGTPNQQSTTLPSLTFGATTTATSQPSGFQFGTNIGQSGFGVTTTTTSTLGLGTTTTTQSSLSLTAPQTTPSLFGGSKLGTISTPATTQSTLSFGTSTSTTATTTSTTNITTGLSNFSTTGPSLGSVIGGKSMLTITGNTAIPLYSNKTSDLQAGRNIGQVPPKCQNVHPSVMELVESFKNHMKDQKHLWLEVSRASLKPISKISDDAENIKRSVLMLERAVNKNNIMNSKLKEETVKALADVEVAQKAMDIPGGFPSDNSIITDYFLQLANKFQQQVLALRVELESTEKSILCELNPVAFTPQELSTTMQRLYECFVALAGRFQFLHANISNLKVQYLELRRKKLEDYTDIFNKKVVTNSKSPIQPSLAGGPSPFTGVRSINSVMSSLGYPSSDMTSTSFSANKPLNNSIFGNSLNQSFQNNNLLSSLPQQSTPGSKRGKR